MRSHMNHDDDREPIDSGRPTKKAKVVMDGQEDEELSSYHARAVNTDDDDDNEQATPQPTEEVRASDLYLDTVSETHSIL